MLGVAEGDSKVTQELECSGREKGQERSLAGLRSCRGLGAMEGV